MDLLPISTVEQRKSPRYRSNRVCYVHPNGTASGMTWGVTIWDISASGVSVVLRSKVRSGTIFAIQPLLKSKAKVLMAQVVRGSAHEDGWFYGCRLLETLCEEDLQEWVE